MKFSYQSLAKTLLLLSVGIGSISGWYAWSAQQELPSLHASARASLKKQKELEAAMDELKAIPAAGAQVVVEPLDKAFAAFILDAMNARVRYAVDIAQATPAKPSAGERTPVEGLADQVPGTKLRSVKVELAGTYADYERFLGFLEHVRKAGAVSVVHLKVKGNTYALTMRVYGKA